MTSIEHFEEQSECVSYNFEPGTQHRLRTPDCLSIPKLVAREFTGYQREHVENCAYCSKVLQMSKHSWFSEVRTRFRLYSDSPSVVLAMRFALVAALVAVIGLSIISQKQIGRLEGSVRVMGAQQAGIGLGLQELKASRSEPARRQVTPGEGIEAFGVQQRELARENQRLHQDLLVEQRQIEALRSELSNITLALSSDSAPTKSIVSSLAISGNPAMEYLLSPDGYGPRESGTGAGTEPALRWTMFKLAKGSKETNELSWIAIPAGKEDSVPVGDLGKAPPVSAIAPSVAVFTRVLRSMPVEITGEPEGNDVKVHSISFLSKAKTTSSPTVDPGIVIHISR